MNAVRCIWPVCVDVVEPGSMPCPPWDGHGGPLLRSDARPDASTPDPHHRHTYDLTGRRLRRATNNVDPSSTPALDSEIDSSNISQPFSLTENS